MKHYYDDYGHLPDKMNGRKDFRSRIEGTTMIITSTKHSPAAPQRIIRVTNNSTNTSSKDGEPLDTNRMLKMSITGFYMLGFLSAAAFGLAGVDPTGEIIPSVPDRFTIGGIITALLGAILAQWRQGIKERNEHRAEVQANQQQITELIKDNQKSIVEILTLVNTKKDK
jgi:hypothetical protein